MIQANQSAISREKRMKLLFFLGALICLFLFITQVPNILVSLLLAFVLYYLLAPSVDWLERRGLTRTWATVIPFLILSAVVGLSGYLLAPEFVNQTQSLRENFPKYLESGNHFLNTIQDKINEISQNVYPFDLRDHFQKEVTGWAQVFFQKLPEYLSRSLTVLFLAPFLALFMLLDGRDFVRQLLSLVPNQFFELALNLNYQIGSQVGGFIRARMIENILVGLMLWIGLLILGFPYALVLAIFAAILNIIPYLGPLLGAIPAFLICFSNGASPTELASLLTIYGVAQLVDTVLLVPLLVAKIVDLHPVTVIFAIILGSQMLGILGMIICIPVVSALKVTLGALYRHFTDFRT